MAIQNNTNFILQPVNVGKTSVTKKPSETNVSELAPVVQKNKSAPSSMVLSKRQKDNLEETLGYDKPGHKERGALDIYHQVSTQKQREEIIDSMSFHFVV